MCADGLRLFVAADIPREIRKAVAGVIEPLKARVPGGRWVKPENLHITLKFIGEYEKEALERLSNHILAATRKSVPFVVCLGDCGAFPSPARARVLWVGMTEGGEEAAVLARRLDARLERAGVRREGREYRGHLTLARLKNPVDCRMLMEELAHGMRDLGGMPFRVEVITLYRSVLGPSGPTYTPLREFVLGGGEGEKD